MQISFDTSSTSPTELTAIIALCASLGGRLPGNLAVAQIVDGPAAGALPTPTLGKHDGALPPEDELAAAHAPTPDEKLADATTDLTGPVDDVPSPPETVELDADGIPWDERIHASTKTQTAKGVWTKKRNVDEVTYGQVHAELQERYAPLAENAKDAEVPRPPTSSEGASSADGAGSSSQPADTEGNDQSTTDESAPTDDTDVPPPPAPAASGGFSEFPELVQAVSGFGLPYVKLAELAGTVSDGAITKFPDLRTRSDLWDDFFALAQSAA